MKDAMQEFFAEQKFIPSKKLGQNFLINEHLCTEIVAAIDQKGIDCVVEIGPGLGAISQHLVQKPWAYIGIELDKRLYSFMRKKYGQLPNVQLINQDVLRVDFRQLLKQYSQPIIVSNLPYAISSLVMLNFLKNKQINTMYVMLQKEMVERISALPKHKQYNNLSALMQYYCRIEKLFNVNANNFYPVPLIDSIVIKLTKNEHPYDFKFDKFLQLAFHAKRKTLFNNLKGTYFSAQLSLIMNELKINQLVRAEALTSEQLYLLYTKITLPNQ